MYKVEKVTPFAPLEKVEYNAITLGFDITAKGQLC